jgi:hypothetical protein
METMTRTQVRAVSCPACAAGEGERCRGVRGRPREANHRERVDAAERASREEVGRGFNVGLIED